MIFYGKVKEYKFYSGTFCVTSALSQSRNWRMLGKMRQRYSIPVCIHTCTSTRCHTSIGLHTAQIVSFQAYCNQIGDIYMIFYGKEYKFYSGTFCMTSAPSQSRNWRMLGKVRQRYSIPVCIHTGC